MQSLRSLKKQVQLIWYFFKPYKVRMAFLLVVMMLSGFMTSLNMAALYPVINYGLNLRSSSYILSVFDKIIKYIAVDNLFMSACVVLLVVTVLSLTSKYLYYYFSNRIMVDIVGKTQKRILDKYISADYGFFVNSKQGKLIHTGIY